VGLLKVRWRAKAPGEPDSLLERATPVIVPGRSTRAGGADGEAGVAATELGAALDQHHPISRSDSPRVADSSAL
jgi:hypothetical protein